MKVMVVDIDAAEADVLELSELANEMEVEAVVLVFLREKPSLASQTDGGSANGGELNRRSRLCELSSRAYWNWEF